ncbi:hypothetical protein KGM_212466 [Danaus plexippus plexippus]|uniref:Uncharacterized protein n=1 Tax=Danaus plexippus plexippus TaxID=278856 RepID=A0A212FJH0_DANPL|nr:hypothetical protein KGM_212466 [Danaus plexippus plexippus]
MAAGSKTSTGSPCSDMCVLPCICIEVDACCPATEADEIVSGVPRSCYHLLYLPARGSAIKMLGFERSSSPRFLRKKKPAPPTASSTQPRLEVEGTEADIRQSIPAFADNGPRPSSPRRGFN